MSSLILLEKGFGRTMIRVAALQCTYGSLDGRSRWAGEWSKGKSCDTWTASPRPLRRRLLAISPGYELTGDMQATTNVPPNAVVSSLVRRPSSAHSHSPTPPCTDDLPRQLPLHDPHHRPSDRRAPNSPSQSCPSLARFLLPPHSSRLIPPLLRNSRLVPGSVAANGFLAPPGVRNGGGTVRSGNGTSPNKKDDALYDCLHCSRSVSPFSIHRGRQKLMCGGFRLLRRGMHRIWRDAWGSEELEGRGGGRVEGLLRSLRPPRARGGTREVQLDYPGEWGID